MKHTIISLLLLGLILTFSLWSSGYVTKAVEETSGLLEEAIRLERTGNDHGAEQMIQAARARWKRHEVMFGTVLRHDEVDEVMLTFASLSSYAQTREREEFLSGCASLLARLRHIREMEKPDFHNIM